MNSFHLRLDLEFNKLTASEKMIINEVWENRTGYIRWPVRASLLWPVAFGSNIIECLTG